MSPAHREGVSLTVTGNHCNVVLLHRGLREAGGVAGEGRCLQVLLFRKPGLAWSGVGESSAKSEETSVSSPSSFDAFRLHFCSMSPSPSSLDLRPIDDHRTRWGTGHPWRREWCQTSDAHSPSSTPCSLQPTRPRKSSPPSSRPALDRAVTNAPLARTRRACECGCPGSDIRDALKARLPTNNSRGIPLRVAYRIWLPSGFR
jgi:hypothetical protein